MDRLDILHPIAEERLNQRYYFQSLLDEACSCGLLSQTDILKTQTEILVILAGQTEKLNKGKSDSVRIEKAQDILISVIFVIGVQLKSYPAPELAVNALKSEPLNLLFEKGLKLIHRKIVIARHTHKLIVDQLFDSPNVYYRSTVIDGINGFFKLYRPQFTAHEIHITVDYPAFMGRPELDGIEFIERYLRYMEAENAFCTLFVSQDIHHLLCGLTQDYRSVPMNMFEPVLLSALGLIMVKREPLRLDLTKADVDALYQLLHDKKSDQIQSCLEKSIAALNQCMELSQSSKNYALLSLPILAATIHNAVKMRTLDKVFLVPAFPEQEPQLTLSYGERMDDRRYQKLVEAVLQSDSSAEKLDLILREVRSLADLLDILSDAELDSIDFTLLVNNLPPAEFIALLSQYPNDDFLERDSDQFLYGALQERKRLFSAEEQKQIEKALDALQNG